MKQGNYGVLLTTFDTTGVIDYALYRDELIHCRSTGLTGIMVSGSTGEFPYFSTNENKVLFKEAKTIIGDQKELIAGISGPRESDVLANITNAHSLGYTLAIACPPYYYPQNDTAVFDFYSFIAKNLPSDMNLVLYNIPFCAPAISIEIFLKLIQIPNIVGIKDSSGNMLYLERLVAITKKNRPDFSIFTGQDSTILAAIATGASGAISSGTWMLDKWICKIPAYLEKGDFISAQDIQHWITEIMLHLDAIPFPENYRALASCLGFNCGKPQRQFSCLAGKKYKTWEVETKEILSKYIF